MRALSYCCSLIFLVMLTGCKSVYYDALERTGVSKQDILIERFGKLRNAQLEASDQLDRTMRNYRSIALFQGGDVAKRIEQLNTEYRTSELRARNMLYHRQGVENVADDLFDEWRDQPDARKQTSQEVERVHLEYERLHAELIQIDEGLAKLLVALEAQTRTLAKQPTQAASDIAGIESDASTLTTHIRTANEQINRFIVNLRSRS